MRDGWYVGQAYYPFLEARMSAVVFVFSLKCMYLSTIYHLYNAGPEPVNYTIYPLPEEERQEPRMAKIFKRLAISALVLGTALLVFTYVPQAYYSIKAGGVAITSKLLSQTAQEAEAHVTGAPQPVKQVYQPRIDPKLPIEGRIKISAVGVDTELVEAPLDNYEDALRKGVWRVSDFGTPYDRQRPTILAAHRYGYLAWDNLFRRKNSFYNLPNLEVGETVEITWKQRKYVYEVYAEDKGEEITDYTADLILYTCENLNSPVRIFKYARLLEI